MNNKEKKDEFNGLTFLDDEQIEMIAEKYPVCDKSVQKRIAALCEEKLAMKKDEFFYNYDGDEIKIAEKVDVHEKTPWYRSRFLTVAASFVVVFGAAAGVIAGVKKLGNNDKKTPLSVVADKRNVSESSIAEELEKSSGSLLESFNVVDGIYGGKIDKDTSKTRMIGSVEYAKITDARFQTKNNLLDYMNSFMTENMINNRYADMFDSDDAWCAEFDGELYGKVSARASGYTFVGTPVFSNITDNTAEMTVSYDDYDSTSDMIFNLKKVNNIWKIDDMHTQEKAEINKETDTKEDGNKNNIMADYTKNEYVTALLESINLAERMSSGNIKKDETSKYLFNGEEYAKIIEPGFSISDIQNQMNSMMSSNILNSRYLNVFDTNTPWVIKVGNDAYGKLSARGAAFIFDTAPFKVNYRNASEYYVDLLVPYDDYGNESIATLKLVKEGEGWKLDSIDIPVVSETVPEPIVTQEKTTEAATVPVTGNDAPSVEPPDIDSSFIGAIDYIEFISSGGLHADESNIYNYNGFDYAPVVKTQFSSVADVEFFMQSVMTQKLINSRYYSVLNGEYPELIDVEGVLYEKVGGKGAAFSLNNITNFDFENVTENTADMILPYNDYGVDTTLTICLVKENGIWKADDIIL